MKVDIPEPVIYVEVGMIVDRIVKAIIGKNIIENVSYYLSEKQRLMKIEARIVVDVMGDVIGYLSDNGDIIKGDLNVN